VDILASLLNGPQAHGAFLLRTMMDPPWCIRIEDCAPLSLIALIRGDAWVIPADEPPVALHAGDVAIARGPDPYTLADDPATPPQAVIHPGQECRTAGGAPLTQAMDLGVRTWGNDPSGSTVMLSGTYETTTAIGERLLAALPPLLVIPEGTWDNPLVAFLGDEIVKEEPGQEVVLDRLLDLLVISVLRAWFARRTAEAPAWYAAHSDPVVGRALRVLYNNPTRPWTVAKLAAEVGMSRAALARRFTEMVGESPMAFLTGWRLAIAADLLREPDATVTGVAHQVGYGSPFALSTAFKRAYGVSPQQHKRQAAPT
jgi:AraC-like DNA-binding protein